MCTIQNQSECNGIHIDNLISSSQKEEFCFARFICWRCIYRKERKTLLYIAAMYKRKSHSTIISGIKVIDNMQSCGDKKYIQAISNHKCFCTNEQLDYCI